MVFKTWLSDINKVALAMDGLQSITQFKTGSTIANGMKLSEVAVNKYKASIEGLSLSQAQVALSTTALNDAQKEQILISAGLLKTTDSITASEIKQTVTENILTAEKQQEILATFELEMAEGKLTWERLEAIATEDSEAGAIARLIVAKKGENAQNLKNIASGKALTAVLKEQLLALATNPMAWVVAGLAGVVTVAYQCSRAIEEVEAKAQELNETFSASKTEIENYKTQIDDLHKIINDSGSSIEDVTTARQNLMTIQDQLIEKFGDEKDTIDLITDAINGQTDALNVLTEAQWQAAKNEFNESGFWNDVANGIDGYSNNIDRMLGEYEGYSVTIDMSEYGGTLFTEGYDEFKQMLMDDFGATISKSSTAALELSGSASEVRQKLLDIQEVLKENSTYKPDDTFNDYLGGLERSTDDVIEKYEDFYKQYVLYEEIFTNDTFTDSYKKINDAYSEYKDAFATGDEESIKKAQDNFANILTQATEGVSDESVVDFFNGMYPDLQEVVGNWQFETNFTANTDGLKDDVSGHLSGLDGLYSYDLKNFSYNTATEEQKASYDGLISVARLYGLTIDQLIDKLVLMGLVQDEEYQKLVDQFGKENIAKIAPEDLTYAYQIKNIGELSFEELQAEIQRLKDEASNPDETTLSTSDILSPIQALTKGLEQLDSIYADVLDSITEDGKDFDWSSILNNDSFKEAFNVDGLTDEYNNFIETIANSPTDIEACQGAFNSLATAYVYNSDALKNVTEETKGATIAMLEQMGVSNALEVVEASLADKAFDMAEAERIATLHSIDLTNVTYDEINALLEEEAVSEFTAQKLAYYALQKQLANDEVISTSGDCQNIINLAKTAGYTTSALVRLAEIKKAFENDSIIAETMRNNIDKAIKNVLTQAEADANNINFSLPEIQYNGGSATQKVRETINDAKAEAEKTLEEIQAEWKEYLEKYLNLYKAELDAGLIDFNTFLNKSRSLIDEYYRDGKISAQDYWDFVGNLYEQQLSIYDRVLSAVDRRIEKEINGIQNIVDELEKQNELYEQQLDEMDGILSVVDSVYEKEIQRLEDEKDLLQDKIDAINDTNSALDLQYRKEQALYALQHAQSQRTKKVFNGTEFVYSTDRDAIRDAKQTLQDIETEELIYNLEREQKAIDAEIELLERYKELWAEITDAYDTEINEQLAIALWGKDYEKIILSNRLADIENFKNNYVSIQKQINSNEELIKSYNEKVEYYEKLRDQWADIADAYENAQNDMYASMVLGANWEKDVLSGRISTLNSFKNEYIAIQQAIANAALESARAQAQASSIAASGGSSGGSGSGSSSSSSGSSGNTSNNNTNSSAKNYWVYKTLGSYSNSGQASSQIGMLNGDGVICVGGKYLVIKWKQGFSTSGEASSKISFLGGSGVYKRYHTGLEQGIVGANTTTKDLELIKALSLNNDEIPVILQRGESVITQAQMGNLSSNLKTLMDYASSITPTLSVAKQNYHFPSPTTKEKALSISIGDIKLYGVQDTDTLANAIIKELPSKVTQAIYKK